MVRRLLGKNFLVVQRVHLAAKARHAERLNEGGKDEGAETASYEGYDKVNQSKRKNGCKQQLVDQ